MQPLVLLGVSRGVRLFAFEAAQIPDDKDKGSVQKGAGEKMLSAVVL